MSTEPVPQELQDAAPSTKLVYRELREDGPLTTAELGRRLYLARSTLSECYAELREADLLTTAPTDDARRKQFDVDP